MDLDLLIVARNISRIYIYIDSTRRSWDPGGEKQLVSFHPSLDCCGPSASIFVSSLTFFDGHEFSSQFSSRDVNEPFDTLGGGARERERVGGDLDDGQNRDPYSFQSNEKKKRVRDIHDGIFILLTHPRSTLLHSRERALYAPFIGRLSTTDSLLVVGTQLQHRTRGISLSYNSYPTLQLNYRVLCSSGWPRDYDRSTPRFDPTL